MKTAVQTIPNRTAFLTGAAATLAVAALSFAGNAEARDNVYWSVGVGSPGAVLNVGNYGPVYQQSQPVYVQPAPVYVQPHPVYVQPRPVYSQPPPIYYEQRPLFVRPAPAYVAPQPIYYERPHERRHGHGHGDGYGHRRWNHEGQYMQAPRPVYGSGYGPVYFERDGRNVYRHDDRR